MSGYGTLLQTVHCVLLLYPLRPINDELPEDVQHVHSTAHDWLREFDRISSGEAIEAIWPHYNIREVVVVE